MPVTITFTADTAAAAAEDLKTFVGALGGVEKRAADSWWLPSDAADPTLPTVNDVTVEEGHGIDREPSPTWQNAEAEPVAEADVVDFPKRGRGRPKKQVDIEAVANPEPTPLEPARTHDPVETTMAGIDALTAPEPEKVPDIEEVRAWVKKVLDRRGGAAVEPLFKDFLKADGSMARKVSEIQEHDRVAIINRAKEALGE